MKWFVTVLLSVFFFGMGTAGAQDLGVPLTITVIDAATEAPIPTAVVRHPAEANRHQVNTANGSTTISVLYMEDGTELAFKKKMQVTFEISAPGYLNQKFTYVMRGKRNKVTVPLTKMNIEVDMDEDDDPVIQFGRDRPIDGRPIE